MEINTLKDLYNQIFFEDAGNTNYNYIILGKNLKSLRGLFEGKKGFNADISLWNTENIEDFSYLFCNAKSFNQPLEWDTSKATNMCSMFEGAKSFNKRLDFNTENVQSFERMFRNAKLYNQKTVFSTKSLKTAEEMFYNAESFNDYVKLEGMYNSKRMFGKTKSLDKHTIVPIQEQTFWKSKLEH